MPTISPSCPTFPTWLRHGNLNKISDVGRSVCVQYFFVLLVWIPVLAHDHGHPPLQTGDGAELPKIQFFEKRILSNPSDSIGLAHLGGLYLVRARRTARHAHYRQSEQTFRQLLRLHPSDKSGLVGLSYALVGQHRFTEALTHAREVGERNASDMEIRLLLGDVHFALGNYIEAEMFFKGAILEKRGLTTLARMAQIAEARGDSEAAEELYQEAPPSH